MQKRFSTLLAVCLLLGLAQVLSACAVYAPAPRPYYYGPAYGYHEGWHRW